MRLRSVIAPNMREGMRRVREQFGDEAIIVSTEETENGVLIMAATERPEPSVDEPDDIEDPAAGEPAGTEAPASGEPRFSAPPASPLRAAPVPPPSAANVPQCLDFHGVPRKIAADLAAIASSAATASEADALGAALDKAVGFSPLDPGLIRHALMLVGGAGAGKTVVLAKLAAQARIAGREVAAITADTARSGGTVQLAGFMRAIGADLWPLDRAEDLPGTISMAKPDSLVLIDSPAANPFDYDDFPLLKQLTGSVEPILVMPAGLQADDAAEAAAAMKQSLGVRRLIATRLDTSRRYGAVIAAARLGRVSLAGFSDSRRIAEPVKPADPQAFARLLLNQMASRAGA